MDVRASVGNGILTGQARQPQEKTGKEMLHDAFPQISGRMAGEMKQTKCWCHVVAMVSISAAHFSAVLCWVRFSFASFPFSRGFEHQAGALPSRLIRHFRFPLRLCSFCTFLLHPFSGFQCVSQSLNFGQSAPLCA